MYSLIAIPLISALIGWFTNWVAIQMLFHPRHPRKILGITFHGVFPKHQAEVAGKIGNMIATELLTPEDVAPHLKSDEQMAMIKETVTQKIDDYLVGTFQQKHPVLAMLLGEKRKDEFKQEILEEIEFFTPEIIDKVMSKVHRDFDVAKIITERVATLEVDKLEELMMSILAREFKFVEYIGGVIGFVLGLFQVGLALMS